MVPMTRLLVFTFVLFALTAPSAPAATQGHKTCEYASTITRFAQQILRDRAEQNRIQKRRSGDSAAHMLITYGGLGQNEARRLFQQLAQNSPRRLKELTTTWAYDAGSDQDRAQVKHSAGFDFVSYSVLRSMLDFDQGRSFLKALSELPASDNQAMIRMQSAVIAGHITAGWDAARRADLISYAIATGHLDFAAGVLAAGPDRDAYLAFIKANEGRPELRAQQPMRVFDSLMTVPNNTGPFQLEPDRLERDTRTYRMLQYAYTHSAMDYLLIFYNQTGEEDAVYQTADVLMKAVEQGRLNPALDPYSARAMAYEELVKRLDRKKVDQTLSSFDMAGPQRLGRRARDRVDWAIAVTSIRKLIEADTPANRARPEGLSQGFDWDMWVAAYDSLDSGLLTESGSSESRALVAAEIFFAVNRMDDAFKAITAGPFKPQQRIRLYQDFMLRLDRQCAGYAMARGQGMMLGGQSVFRFKD